MTKQNIDITMNRNLGTKWFMFYTKVKPWLHFFFIFGSIGEFAEYTDLYMQYWWLTLSFVFKILHSILCIAVFIKSRGRYIDFVPFVKVVLFFETISFAYQQAVTQYISNLFETETAINSFMVLFVIYFLLWYILNVNYFNKRINYGASDTDIEEANHKDYDDCSEYID